MKIGIVGLGLIGGSMARCIKKRTEHTVFGLDTDSDTMAKAFLCGVIDEKLTEANIPSCDFILVALCPEALVSYVKSIAHLVNKNTIVADLCGVKRAICSQLLPVAKEYGFSFVGGHPMAGKEKGGFDNSSDDLFDGAPMILTPEGTEDLNLLTALRDFFLSVGFDKVVFSTTENHDHIIAYTSQLAHVLSNAYVKAPSALKHTGFSAGSFLDMTRVATLDENMWTELFLANKDYLTQELDILIANLSQYAQALKDSDADTLRSLLREGRLLKAACDKMDYERQ